MVRLVAYLFGGMLLAAYLWGDPPETTELAASSGTGVEAEPAGHDVGLQTLVRQIAVPEAPDAAEPAADAPAPPPSAQPEAAAVAAAPAPVPAAPAPEPVRPAAEPLRQATVTGSRVNFREGPSTGDAVVGQVVEGEIVELVGQPVGGWQQIRIEGDGGEGWIFARFLQPDG